MGGYPHPWPGFGGGGGLPSSQVRIWGGSTPIPGQDRGYSLGLDGGTPPSEQVGGTPPPPGDRAAERALAMRRAVCLLRSR